MSIGAPEDQQTHPADGDAGLYPCTLLQERFWAERDEVTNGLNIAMRWLVTGTLSHAAAQGALQALVQRHEIFRTSFREVDGRPMQVVHPTSALKLRDIDLSFLSADEGQARADEIARAEAVEAFDPAHAPLLRATILRFAPDRAVLLLTFHSLVADGWTTGLVVSEFRTAANAIDTGNAPDASPPDLQFADYALWEKESLASGGFDEARAFWQKRLRTAVGTEVPADRLPSAPPAPSHITSFLLPAALTQSVEGFARRQNSTLYSLAAASLALMLRRVTGEREIVFGSQVANREEQVSESLVGPTVNSITLCLPVDDGQALRDFARTATDTVLEALQHQRLPFEIAQTYAPRPEGKPLHAINLVVHRSYSGMEENERDTRGRFSLVSLPSYSSGTPWALNFYLIGRDEGWRISCEADARLYTPQTAHALLDGWRRCLEAFTTEADRRVAEAPALQAIALRTAPERLPAPLPVAPGRAPIPVDDPQRHVARFHESGTRTPMIVLNNRSVYYQLARQLGADRPFTDIVLYHQDGKRELGAYNFEEFGAYAVQLIRSVQPHGPYILGGHCVYGVLAFEAARQLRRLGEEVSLVALFDSWGPGYRETMSRWDKFLRRQQLRLQRYGERYKRFRRGEVGLKEMILTPLLFHLGLSPRESGPVRQWLPGEWFDGFLYDKVQQYRPTPYDGNVVLFRTNDPLRGRLFDDRMGWAPLVSGGFTKIDIDSGHFDMFRERPARAIASFLEPM